MNQHPPLEVSEADWLIIQAILRAHVPDYTVWAFGSRATGNAKKFSDLDLAIIGEQSMGLNLIPITDRNSSNYISLNY